LAVAGLYWPRIVQMLRGLLGKDERGRRLLLNIFIAFLPAAVLGVMLDDLIEEHLFHPWPVLAALFLGGLWMIWLDRWRAQRAERKANVEVDDDAPESTREALRERGEIGIEDLTWRRALLIGLLQCLAMWPGTSRSMMTIAGGTLLGLRPKDAAEFSFLLGLPTLGGACVYKLGKNLKTSLDEGGPNMFEQLGLAPTLLGFAVAAVAAALAIKWLVAFLTRHGLHSFGWYRIALCAVLGGLILADVVQIG
ncbi:MAG: undecaprenyl-diphosphate phosphatase, partial [Planctomycetota bacterium]|nr:undecaprenyl-diphosphate phosphatase [Planctomycetota bacterium]